MVSVMLNLSEPGLARYGHDSRYAELVMHIEPRDHGQQATAPMDFGRWYTAISGRWRCLLRSRNSFAEDVGVATYADPPAECGIELWGYRSLTELVDSGVLRPVPGSWQSNQFLGYMIASRNGKSAGDVAVSLLTALCDHGLRLDNYESALASWGMSAKSAVSASSLTAREGCAWKALLMKAPRRRGSGGRCLCTRIAASACIRPLTIGSGLTGTSAPGRR